jgi:hypothetical protein
MYKASRAHETYQANITLIKWLLIYLLKGRRIKLYNREENVSSNSYVDLYMFCRFINVM